MIMFMDSYLVWALALFGLVLGSFAGAQVWRLRARQLAVDKKQGEKYDKHEYAMLQPLMGRKQSHDRSQCLTCSHTLGAKDLIPLFSWALSGGRCRYCGARIGIFEPLIELATAALFVLSFLFWPFGFASGVATLMFVLWLVIILLLVMLAVYDIKWQLLPDVINLGFIGASVVFVVLRCLLPGAHADILSVLGAVGILAGLYAFIYVFSKGAWIGLGDVKLGVGLGLLLADWRLAFLALFLANLIGCIIVLPGVLLRRLGSGSRIAFGPLLIVGTLIAFWWGLPIIDALLYKSALLF